jgi:uncharacterized protein (TIGR02186 family)
MRTRYGLKIFCMTAAIVAAALAAPGARAEMTLDTSGDTIPVDAFYNGNTLTVNGTVGGGEGVVVKVASPETTENFTLKEKVAGLFWMSNGKFAVGGVSDVYMLYSSGDLNAMVSESRRKENGLGYDALKSAAAVNPARDTEEIFNEFIKLKEAGGLYLTADGAVKLIPSAGRQSRYSLSIRFPYQLPGGLYRIDVYGVKNGSVVETASKPIKIETVGMVREVSYLAEKHGGVYGAASVAIALLAGFVVTPFIGFLKTLLIFTLALPGYLMTLLEGSALGNPVRVTIKKNTTHMEMEVKK